MSRLRCPRCKTLFERTASVQAQCPSCGFTGRTDAHVPAGNRWNVPDGPAGKTRTPLLVVLLHILTLGVYALVWSHKVFQEVDARFRSRHRTGLFVVGLLLWLPAVAVGAWTLYDGVLPETLWLAAAGGTALVGAVLLLGYFQRETEGLNRAHWRMGAPAGVHGESVAWLMVFALMTTVVAALLLAAHASSWLPASRLLDGDVAGFAVASWMAGALLALALILHLTAVARIQASADRVWTTIRQREGGATQEHAPASPANAA